MGNCICTPPSNPNTSTTTSQQQQQQQQQPRIRVDVSPSEDTSALNKQRRRKKTVVKIEEDGECGEGIESKAGGKGVRIRVVLTQQELKEILDEYHNYSSSMEELLRSALKRRVRRSGRDCNKVHKGGWRPALHTIPEDIF